MVTVKLFTGSYDGTVRVWDASGLQDETVFSKDDEEKQKAEKERQKARKKRMKDKEKAAKAVVKSEKKAQVGRRSGGL